MVVTIFCQYCTKLAASVALATYQGYHEPLNSQPRRKMALASPSLTRFRAKVVKYES